MKKGSWKLRSMPEAAEAIRTSPSLRAAATKLGVNVSTLSRAVKAGTLPTPSRLSVVQPTGRRQVSDPGHVTTAHATFAEWARATYQLSRAEDEMVTLAQQALDLARDPESSPTTKLQAMAQFRATLRELHLPEEDAHGHAQTPARSLRRA